LRHNGSIDFSKIFVRRVSQRKSTGPGEGEGGPGSACGANVKSVRRLGSSRRSSVGETSAEACADLASGGTGVGAGTVAVERGRRGQRESVEREKIPQGAQALIVSLLQPNTSLRMTAAELLIDEWCASS
jgi:hypothetical protein